MGFFNYLLHALPQERQAPTNLSTPAPVSTALPRLLVGGNSVYTPRVQKIAESLNHQLPNWTIMILDDNQWKDWSKHNPNASVTDGAFSILGTNRTFISQGWLSKWPDERLQRNLAHELGHLTLNTHEEEKADKFADNLMKGLKKKK